LADLANREAPLERDANARTRYGLSIILVAVAYAMQRALWPHIPPSPHLLFYPAVFASARLAGRNAGILATALSTFAIAYGFLPPEGVLAIEKASDVLDLGIFAAVGVAMSIAIGQLRAALARERAAAERATQAKESTDATWSMVAHDLRTPLSVITLGSSQLGQRMPLSADMEKTIGMIKRSTDRARTLLDDALDAMKATEGKLAVEPGPCDPRELCEHALDAVSLIASRKGVRLEADVSTRSAIVCDQPRVEQVLTNLLGNAIKFTARNGVVSLYVDEVTEPTAGLEFAVHDTGKGIPEEELKSIFTKFWSSAHSTGGSGLGLWIACAILEAHGTTMSVESRVGQGTTFRFTLPKYVPEDEKARVEVGSS
jgi:signal transduction histidine kinase